MAKGVFGGRYMSATYILPNPGTPAFRKIHSYECSLTENCLITSVVINYKENIFLSPSVRPTLFNVRDMYPLISRTKLDSSVSHDSVIIKN